MLPDLVEPDTHPSDLGNLAVKIMMRFSNAEDKGIRRYLAFMRHSFGFFGALEFTDGRRFVERFEPSAGLPHHFTRVLDCTVET
jgi:hypothetical protein